MTRLFLTIILGAMLWLNTRTYAQESDSSVIILQSVEIEDLHMRARPGFKHQHIDKSELVENIGASLGDLLGQKTPIFIKNYGVGGLQTPSFRGTGASHTKVYWNGMPMNNPMLGQVDLSIFPVAFADEVDVQFGGASLQSGNGGLGGAVHMNTDVNWDKTFAVKASQSAGSYGKYISNLTTQYGNDQWHGLTKLFYKTAENDFTYYNLARPDRESGEAKDYIQEKYPNAGARQYGALQEVHWRYAPKQEVIARTWWQYNDRNLGPTMLTSQRLAQLKANQQDKALRSMLEWRYKTSGLNISAQSGVIRERLNYYKENAPNPKPHAITTSNSEVQTYWGKAQVTHKLSPRLYWNASATTNYSEVLTNNYENDAATQFQQDVHTSLDYESDRLTASLLVRQQLLNEEWMPFLPSASLTYLFWERPTTDWQVKANISRNFNAPSLNDKYWFPVGNPDLKPEEGWTGELGLIMDRKGAWVNWNYDLTGFYANVNNWIIWVPGVSRLWRPENRLKVFARGLESHLSMNAFLGEWQLQLTNAYSYIRTTNKEVANYQEFIEDRQLIFIPVHNVQSYLRLTYQKAFVSLEHSFYSERYVDTQEKSQWPPYTVVNLIAGYEWQWAKHKLLAQLRVNNLTGYHYQSIPYYPMPPRNYLFTLTYQWH